MKGCPTVCDLQNWALADFGIKALGEALAAREMPFLYDGRLCLGHTNALHNQAFQSDGEWEPVWTQPVMEAISRWKALRTLHLELSRTISPLIGANILKPLLNCSRLRSLVVRMTEAELEDDAPGHHGPWWSGPDALGFAELLELPMLRSVHFDFSNNKITDVGAMALVSATTQTPWIGEVRLVQSVVPAAGRLIVTTLPYNHLGLLGIVALEHLNTARPGATAHFLPQTTNFALPYGIMRDGSRPPDLFMPLNASPLKWTFQGVYESPLLAVHARYFALRNPSRGAAAVCRGPAFRVPTSTPYHREQWASTSTLPRFCGVACPCLTITRKTPAGSRIRRDQPARRYQAGGIPRLSHSASPCHVAVVRTLGLVVP